MNKSLVIDVDGVLIRDPLLLAHVKSNVTDYVRSKVPKCQNPERLNAMLYKKYGHTALGLERVFKSDISDFNRKVYDRKLHDHLWSVLSGTEFQEEAVILHEISRSGWDVTLFTDAPIQWVASVKNAISDRLYFYKNETYFKTDPRVYNYFSKKRRHLYVDDSIKNLATAWPLDNWTPVHFNNGVPRSKEFPTVGSIWEVGLMCNSLTKLEPL